MQHQRLSRATQYDGGYTDLFIIGTKRVRASTAPYAFTSDFAGVAATTQTITLLALTVGDVIIHTGVQAWVKQKFTDHATEDTAATTLANLKCDIGYTGTTTAFIAGTNADLQQAVGAPTTGPVAAALNYAHKTGAVNLLATLTSTAGNMSTITYGDLWIYVTIARASNHVLNLQY